MVNATFMIRGLCLGLLLAGCESSGGGQSLGETGPENVPPIKVVLPPPPAFDRPKVPLVYPDQTLSVYGVRHAMDEHLGKDIRVKAVVIDVYQCPVCKRGNKCPPCALPHFWLADARDTAKDKWLLVADLPYDDRGKPKKLDLTVGQMVAVAGTFTKQSNTGFSSSEGLLVYKEHALAQ
jgi:hypothetical protein